MSKGASVINTSSIQADNASPQLLPYAATKAAIQKFTGGLAQMLGKKGVRVNCVAPGRVWTPLIPATMPPEKVKTFGQDVALGRPGAPPRWSRGDKTAGGTSRSDACLVWFTVGRGD